MGSILRGLRKSGFATRFADAFSDDLDIQRSYGRGILSIACFFGAVVVVWAFILIVLKVKGKEVGCASGAAFHLVQIDDEGETDSSSGEESNSYKPSNSRDASRAYEFGREVALADIGSTGYDAEIEDDQSSWATEPDRARTSYQSKMKETPLERKTRICFLFCSIVSLFIVPFILVFSFGPMKEATEAAKDSIVVRISALATPFWFSFISSCLTDYRKHKI